MNAHGGAQTLRLKYAATINDESLSEETDADYELQYVDIGNVDSSGTIHEIAAHRFVDAPSRARRRVSDGDVIISCVRTYLQAIAPIQQPPANLVVSTGFAVVRPRAGVLDAAFGKYALRESAFLAEVEKRSVGINYPAINASDLGDIPIHVPPTKQQHCVATYLDQETARLDALVVAKEGLLELLAENRRALITHAVTHGLDSGVPLRDSGIPWLGKVPAHWLIMRLRFLLNDLEQGWSPEAESREPSEEEWGVLKLNSVERGRFNPSAKALPSGLEVRSNLEIRAGDFLVTRSNTPALVGDVCFVQETRPRLMLCDLIYRLILCHDKVDGRFLSHFLASPLGRRQIAMMARGTSGSMVKISQEHIKDLWIPVPPLNEQHEIVLYLGDEIGRLEAIQASTERTILLLKERRAALIAAAVTGKIKLEAAT